MDWSKVTVSKFLLKFSYVGTNYQGVAYQNESTPTVETHIFAALAKTCLIPNKDTCEYSRCGRTDKGVHAAGNYFSVNLRIGKNLDYVKMINRCLPDDIRVLSAVPVPSSFDARFSCVARTYRYFFARRKLDISAMEISAVALLGEHDFRNFCKMDVEKTTNYFRTIHSVKFVECGPGFMYCEIRGSAFLWHMVRCIMALLFAVGRGLEKPEIVSDLLDVNKFPRKPNYELADPAGLVLYDAEYPELATASPESECVSLAQESFRRAHEKTLRDAEVLRCLSGSSTEYGEATPGYTEIRKRGTGLSVEEALERSAKRRKLDGCNTAE